MTDDAEYWTEVRDRWNHVRRSANNDWREPTDTSIDEIQKPPRRSHVESMTITGWRGIGKSALYYAMSHQSNKYSKRPTTSLEPHYVRVSAANRTSYWKVVVTTGQVSGEGLEAKGWESMFKPPNHPTGVIYVTAAGYDLPWDPDAVSAVLNPARRLEAANRDMWVEIQKLKWRLEHPGAQPEPEDQKLIERYDDSQRSLPEGIRSENFEKELDHFERFLGVLSSSWRDKSVDTGKTWLVIAVNKADLYWENRRDEVMSYYLPTPAGAAPFQRKLRDFVDSFGGARRKRPRLAVLPIASNPEDYRLGEEIVVRSALKANTVELLQNCFVNALGEFCGPGQ